MLRVDRSLAVDRLSDGVDHASDQRFAHGDFRNAARALDWIAFFDADVVAHQHGTDIVFFKVQRDPVQAARNSSISPAIAPSRP